MIIAINLQTKFCVMFLYKPNGYSNQPHLISDLNGKYPP